MGGPRLGHRRRRTAWQPEQVEPAVHGDAVPAAALRYATASGCPSDGAFAVEETDPGVAKVSGAHLWADPQSASVAGDAHGAQDRHWDGGEPDTVLGVSEDKAVVDALRALPGPGWRPGLVGPCLRVVAAWLADSDQLDAFDDLRRIEVCAPGGGATNLGALVIGEELAAGRVRGFVHDSTTRLNAEEAMELAVAETRSVRNERAQRRPVDAGEATAPAHRG